MRTPDRKKKTFSFVNRIREQFITISSQEIRPIREDSAIDDDDVDDDTFLRWSISA
jgi:hypothetical protein